MKAMSHIRQHLWLGAWLLGAPFYALPGQVWSEAVTYEAAVFTNVRLHGKLYRNADLRLTFVGDTNDIELARDDAGNVLGNGFFWVAKGRASFSITTPGARVSGHFPDGELFVGFDSDNYGIGFGLHGTNVFEPIYPLSLDGIRGSITDLATPVTVTGHAWSCVNFLSGACAHPIAIKTAHRGDLIVEQPYTQLDPYHGGYTGPYSGAMNRAVFTIVSGH